MTVTMTVTMTMTVTVTTTTTGANVSANFGTANFDECEHGSFEGLCVVGGCDHNSDTDELPNPWDEATDEKPEFGYDDALTAKYHTTCPGCTDTVWPGQVILMREDKAWHSQCITGGVNGDQ